MDKEIKEIVEQIVKLEKELYLLVTNKHNYNNDCDCSVITPYEFGDKDRSNKLCLNCGGMVSVHPE